MGAKQEHRWVCHLPQRSFVTPEKSSGSAVLGVAAFFDISTWLEPFFPAGVSSLQSTRLEGKLFTQGTLHASSDWWGISAGCLVSPGQRPPEPGPPNREETGNASSCLGHKHPGASGKSHQSLKGPEAAACPGQMQDPHPLSPIMAQGPGPISGEVTVPESCPPSRGEPPQDTVQLGKPPVGGRTTVGRDPKCAI